jgi:hypothetical protein
MNGGKPGGSRRLRRRKPGSAAEHLRSMAAENVPDLDQAAVELLRLERQEQDLSRALDVMANRNERFPNVVTEQRLGHMEAMHDALLRRILDLRAALLPVRSP